MVSLREWRVEDFSAVYVAHRDHLVRYARRVLPNGWEAEEVVQDAFLYLMTALPELDSEVGVLRFLKWKTKMLAIDVNRSKSRFQETHIEEITNFEASGVDPVDSLIRADDAAVVRLALAKLSDRQRDALIATQLEGKPIEVVAGDLGLSPNAFRQLLHRARASFKLALVGEAEIRGLSAPQILSIAARKAGQGSVRRIGAATVLLIALAGFGPALLIEPFEIQEASFTHRDRLLELAPSPVQSTSDSEALLSSGSEGQYQQGLPSMSDLSPEGTFTVDDAVPVQSEEFQTTTDILGVGEVATLTNELDELLFRLSSFEPEVLYSESQGNAILAMGDELEANIGYDLDSESVVQFVTFTVKSQFGLLTAVPTSGISVIERDGELTRVTYAATDLLVGDFSGFLDFATSDDSRLSKSGYIISLSFGVNEELIAADLKLIPRI